MESTDKASVIQLVVKVKFIPNGKIYLVLTGELKGINITFYNLRWGIFPGLEIITDPTTLIN